MGIAGAAYATGIGQCITLIAYLLFYFFCHTPIHLKWKHMNFDMTIIKKLYSIGISAALNLALPSLFISLLRYVIVIIPAAYLFNRFVGANGVWYAFCFTKFVSAGFAALIYRNAVTEKNTPTLPLSAR